jgi:serine/threonine-protein kinase
VDAAVERSGARALTESDATLRGRQLGDFVLRECIGEGAFAAVYRCEQPLLGREAVVKVLHQRLRASEVVLQRFLREARLASRIDHPYAAHVYAFGVEPEDGLAWIAMEFVHGTSLERWLTERGPLSLAMLVSFFEDVAEVVQSAHDHGIIHRDLKPSNVMIIESSGRLFPKLLDFGIAKLVDDAAQLEMPGVPVEVDVNGETFLEVSSSGSQNLTQANTTLGSPPYMSPEQWCDPQSVGPRSDLYALAVMAYEALTGTQPFTGPTIAAIADLHCTAEIPSVGDRFPAALDRVFRRALAKQPGDRPATALAFAKELREAARPPRKTDQSVLQTQSIAVLRARRKGWTMAAAGSALVAGAVAAYLVMGAASHRREPALPPAAIAHTVEPPPPPPPPAPVPAAPILATVQPPAEAPPVVVEIESSPRGADVFRLPSETKVGATPWRAELPSEDGKQVFVIKKVGYAERRVEIDLRTGGKQVVKLSRVIRRPGSPPISTVPVRRKGEPVDPFRPAKRP